MTEPIHEWCSARDCKHCSARLSAEFFAPPAPHQVTVPDHTGETRTVSPTGGEKGVKPARFDLIPARPLWQVAEVYGKGADKYADRNWERGYEWSKSYGAMQRHVNLFWQGQDLDEESGLPHLAHAVFHCLAMLEWAATHTEFDDRPKPLRRLTPKDLLNMTHEELRATGLIA